MSETKPCRLSACRHPSGKQGSNYVADISNESGGMNAICMPVLKTSPGARAHAHRPDDHQTAIYMLSGRVHTRYGVAL